MIQRTGFRSVAPKMEYHQAFRSFQEIDYRWGQDMGLNNVGNLWRQTL